MADVLLVKTDRRTSEKRYFLNGARISRRDAQRLMQDDMIVVVYR